MNVIHFFFLVFSPSQGFYWLGNWWVQLRGGFLFLPEHFNSSKETSRWILKHFENFHDLRNRVLVLALPTNFSVHLTEANNITYALCTNEIWLKCGWKQRNSKLCLTSLCHFSTLWRWGSERKVFFNKELQKKKKNWSNHLAVNSLTSTATIVQLSVSGWYNYNTITIISTYFHQDFF